MPNISRATEQPDALTTSSALDISFDADHGRSVITYGGGHEYVIAQVFELLARAVESLTIHEHGGAHPRFGVVDVLPLVPYTVEEDVAQGVARELAFYIQKELDVPVHTYGRAHPTQRSLPELRRYLRTTPHAEHPTAGVVCLGVRDPLVAFNVNFRGDLATAQEIAGSVRTPEIRALAFELASRNLIQVSMNLIAPDQLGPKTAFDRVYALARETDLELVDCEIVGLVPHSTLDELTDLPLRRPVRTIEQALAEKGIS